MGCNWSGSRGNLHKIQPCPWAVPHNCPSIGPNLAHGFNVRHIAPHVASLYGSKPTNPLVLINNTGITWRDVTGPRHNSGNNDNLHLYDYSATRRHNTDLNVNLVYTASISSQMDTHYQIIVDPPTNKITSNKEYCVSKDSCADAKNDFRS